MTHRIGTNQHRVKQKYATVVYLIMIIILLLIWAIGREWTISHPVLSPCPETGCSVKVLYASEEFTRDERIDQWVNKYAFAYAKNRWEGLRTKTLLHFLLLKEQGYGGSANCGDSGLACGPLQFHESTYRRFRGSMMRANVVKAWGSRLDMEDAIQTAAWAICVGREREWGPVLRGEIQL